MTSMNWVSGKENIKMTNRLLFGREMLLRQLIGIQMITISWTTILAVFLKRLEQLR